MDSAAGTASHEGGPLRIVAGRLLAELLMPAWLRALHDQRPATRVALRVSAGDPEVIARVRAGEADLGFIGGPDVPGDLAVRPIGRDRLVVVTHPGHAWARRRRPLPGAELAAAPLLVRAPGSATRSTVESALACWGGVRGPAVESDHTSMLRRAAVRGEAPAILSAMAVRAEVADGRLVEIPVEPGVRLGRTLHALWPRGGDLSDPAHRLLAISSALVGR